MTVVRGPDRMSASRVKRATLSSTSLVQVNTHVDTLTERERERERERGRERERERLVYVLNRVCLSVELALCCAVFI